MNPNRIIAVVGFPRSGTTLAMTILHKLGIPVVADNHVSFESAHAEVGSFHPVWMATCIGRAVKLLEPQRLELPKLEYDFIWCSRNPVEQAKSQMKILEHWVGFTKSTPNSIHRMAMGILNDSPRVKAQLQQFPGMRWLELHFERTISMPLTVVTEIALFVGVRDTTLIQSAANCVRHRNAKCYGGFLEYEL